MNEAESGENKLFVGLLRTDVTFVAISSFVFIFSPFAAYTSIVSSEIDYTLLVGSCGMLTMISNV